MLEEVGNANRFSRDELKRLGDHNKKGYIEQGVSRPKKPKYDPEPVETPKLEDGETQYWTQPGFFSGFSNGGLSDGEISDQGLSDYEEEDEYEDDPEILNDPDFQKGYHSIQMDQSGSSESDIEEDHLEVERRNSPDLSDAAEEPEPDIKVGRRRPLGNIEEDLPGENQIEELESDAELSDIEEDLPQVARNIAPIAAQVRRRNIAPIAAPIVAQVRRRNIAPIVRNIAPIVRGFPKRKLTGNSAKDL